MYIRSERNKLTGCSTDLRLHSIQKVSSCWTSPTTSSSTSMSSTTSLTTFFMPSMSTTLSQSPLSMHWSCRATLNGGNPKDKRNDQRTAVGRSRDKYMCQQVHFLMHWTWCLKITVWSEITYKRPTWFTDYASRGPRLHMKKHTSERMCVQFRSHVTWLQNSIKHLVVYFSSESK